MTEHNKVTLVSLPLMDYNVHRTEYSKILPPIGLGYLATNLHRAGVNVEIIDAEYEKISLEVLIEKILNTSPTLVGLSIPSPLVGRAKIVIDGLKKRNPDITIVVGGIHPSIVREQILRDIPNIDAAFVGESEESLLSFVKGNDMASIKGLIFWNDSGNVTYTGEPDVVDINSLPFPDRKFFPNDPWHSDRAIESYLCSSRGCPFKCTYCSAGTIQGKKIRNRSIDNIITEINYLIHEHRVNYLHFIDDNFIMSREKAYSFCNKLNSLKKDLSWRFLARTNVLSKFNRSDFQMLASSGCDLLSMGVESGSLRVLELIRKEIKLDDVKAVIEKAHYAGIRVKGFFIMGFPFETPEDIKLTKKFILDTDFDDVNISFLRVFPGTELYTQLLEKDFDERQLNEYLQFAEIFGDEATNNERLKKAELYLMAHYMSLNPQMPVERIISEIKNTYKEYFKKRGK